VPFSKITQLLNLLVVEIGVALPDDLGDQDLVRRLRIDTAGRGLYRTTNGDVRSSSTSASGSPAASRMTLTADSGVV
jgi:hypothetical protein